MKISHFTVYGFVHRQIIVFFDDNTRVDNRGMGVSERLEGFAYRDKGELMDYFTMADPVFTYVQLTGLNSGTRYAWPPQKQENH